MPHMSRRPETRCALRSPLRRLQLEFRMRDEAMPHDRLRVRRHLIRIDGGDDDDLVTDLPRVAAIAPDDAEDLQPASPRLVESSNDVHADVPLGVAAADRKHEDGIVRARAAGPEPG